MPNRAGLPKEQRLMNYNNIDHLLEDVEWDLHEGALASYGDWPVENREEFCIKEYQFSAPKTGTH
jgi:hypothetical protein